MEDNLLTMRGGAVPLAAGLVADRETIVLQLEEGDEVGDGIADKP
jgi:hypothetical protein